MRAGKSHRAELTCGLLMVRAQLPDVPFLTAVWQPKQEPDFRWQLLCSVQVVGILGWKVQAATCRRSRCFWQVLLCGVLSQAWQVLGSCILRRSPGLQRSS